MSHSPLAAGEVHVWHADLATVGDGVAAVLSPDERARAGHFPATRRNADEDRHSHEGAESGGGHRSVGPPPETTTRGQQWGRARGVLRVLLGYYVGRQPRTLILVTGETGKPRLAADEGVSFNMSHSASHAVFAFTLDGAIGIDVEATRRGSSRTELDVGALAGRAFGGGEAGRLMRLPPYEREREFLCAWTGREALLKCSGSGIAGAGKKGGATVAWSSRLDLGPDVVASVACERARRELCLFEWERGAREARSGGEPGSNSTTIRDR